MEHFQQESAIWDLHIHTCCCPKASGEFKHYKKEEFVAKIIDIFNKHTNLEFFSFTDHNQISLDVYREYLKQRGKIEFVVGVEQDVYFDDASDVKHLIIYFDINKDNLDDNEEFIIKYNDFAKKGSVYIFELLNFLEKEYKSQFVLSPHAFKQRNRGIDSKWSDEEVTNANAHRYTDQFFCFRESQGYSSIQIAVKFLKDFCLDNRISIISFSDSNNFEKLENYLDKPYQYFSSLPNFKGLQLVGSDIARIDVHHEHICDENKFGNLIGKVQFEDNEITFSDRLNCIIGGRGSGKSLLLDAIANKINGCASSNKKGRDSFIKKFSVSVYNYSNEEIKNANFNIDHYKQSYTTEMFNENSYFETIKKYFGEDLNKIDKIDSEKVKKQNKEKFSKLINKQKEEEINISNISNFVKKYELIDDNCLNIPNAESDSKIINTLEYLDLAVLMEKIDEVLCDELKSNDNIYKAIIDLYKIIISETKKYNSNLLNGPLIKKFFFDNYSKYRNSYNDKHKEKSQTEELIKKTFYNGEYHFIKRVNIINAFISMENDFKAEYKHSIMVDGKRNNAFKLVKHLRIQRPFSFLFEKFKEYFKAKDNLLTFNSLGDDLRNAIDLYCYNDKPKLREGKDLKNLDNDLISFNLKYEEFNEIFYKVGEGGEDYKNILELSPGQQTNVLMEYLVCKNTDKPLLIDQPEDNVDNLTIYNEITKRFKDLKVKRQIIVVTHDANIVINGDAENVIIADHPMENKFKYSNGALEYKDNLEQASIILDGGVDAVKRRLKKYGE